MGFIKEGSTLLSIENQIKKDIKAYEYWGELSITLDDYNYIGERLYQVIQSSPEVDALYVTKHYPYVMTTFCVFMLRYKYDVNFWGLLSDELYVEIPDYQRSEIGSIIRKVFKQNDFDFSEVLSDTKINIAPIMYQACLPPDSSLDDLFYVLKNENNALFDPEILIDDLIEKRSYSIRKPLSNFLKRFKYDKAIDYILEVRDAMFEVDQHNDTDSRFGNRYIDWKASEKEKSTLKSRKSIERQNKPYLYFDNGRKGLCMVLPRIVISNDWSEECIWYVKGVGGFEKKLHCEVVSDDNYRYTEKIIVPVTPCEAYEIVLEEDDFGEESDKQWNIQGIPQDRPLIFNSSGRQINSAYIQRPYQITIIHNDIKISSYQNVQIEYQNYPSDSNDYLTICLIPGNGDSSISFSYDANLIKLISKPHINVNLEGKTLFGLNTDCFDVPLYTEIPDIEIEYDSGTVLRDLDVKILGETYTLGDIDSETIYTFEIHKFFKKKSYGLYSLMFYQYGKFLKQIQFAYVPRIKTNYNPQLSMVDKDSRRFNDSIKFYPSEGWMIEFENANMNHDEEKITVTYSSKIGALKGKLNFYDENISMSFNFSMPVNPYELYLINSIGELVENITDITYRIDIDEYKSESTWLNVTLFGAFKEKDVSIQLVTDNGIEQEEKVKILSSGLGNINLDAFYDTISGCALPAVFNLIIDEKNIPIIRINERLQLLDYPRVKEKNETDYVLISAKEDIKNLFVQRFGFKTVPKTLYYENSKLNKKGDMRGYPYNGRINQGIYIVSLEDLIESSIFEDDTENNYNLELNNNLLYVPRYKGIHRIYNSSEWIDYYIKMIIENQFMDNMNIDTYLKKQILSQIEIKELDDRDIESIVALAYLYNSKISNQYKQKIQKVMKVISTRFLRRGNRLRIIELLVDLGASQEIYDICIENYSLLLFFGDKKKTKSLAQQTMNSSIELSLLLALSSECNFRDTILKEKYRDLIGKEALKHILYVPNESETGIIVAEQKKFLIGEKSKVKVKLDHDIVGDEADINAMFIIKKYEWEFDVKLKPDNGLYFAHIKYIDQYVNWYLKNSENGWIKEQVKKKYKDIMNECCQNVLDAIERLKYDKTIGDMTKEYCSSIKERYSQIDSNKESVGAFLYIQALAAYLAKIPMEFEKYDNLRAIGIRFMSVAFEVAPRLSRRDVLMAGLFIYLKRKEELLCQ